MVRVSLLSAWERLGRNLLLADQRGASLEVTRHFNIEKAEEKMKAPTTSQLMCPHERAQKRGSQYYHSEECKRRDRRFWYRPTALAVEAAGTREARRRRSRQQRGRARASAELPTPEPSSGDPGLMREALTTVAAAMDRMSSHLEQSQARSGSPLSFFTVSSRYP